MCGRSLLKREQRCRFVQVKKKLVEDWLSCLLRFNVIALKIISTESFDYTQDKLREVRKLVTSTLKKVTL